MAQSKKPTARGGATDRRAVVEQMRREQQRADRRRGLLVVGAAVLLGLAIIGVAALQAFRSDDEPGGALTGVGVAAGAAGCQEVVEWPATGNNEHLPEGQPITYENTPPADGPHWGEFLQGPSLRTFFTTDDRPPVERLVHSLEHGHTILWYDDERISDEQRQTVEDIADTFQAGDPEEKFIAAPWTSEDGDPFPDGATVALTHWSVGGDGDLDDQLGVWQFCDDVSGEAVHQFMEDYPASDSPEPDAP